MRVLRYALPDVALILSVLAFAGCTTSGSFSRSGKSGADEGIDRADKPLAALAAYEMSRVYLSQERYHEAEKILIRIRREYPGFLPALCDLGRLYYGEDRIDQAVEVLAEGLEISPRNPVLLNNLGLCRLSEDKVDEAIRVFSKACEIEPENQHYAANLAVGLAMAGRFEESREVYERFLSKEDAEHNVALIREAKPAWRGAAFDRQ